jgi:WD40 repeat protein
MSRCFVQIVCLAVLGNVSPQTTSAQTPKSDEQSKPARVDAFGDALPPGALARLGTARFRHGGLELAGFAANGKALVYFDHNAVHIRDVGGKDVQVLALGDKSGSVVSGATSGDGRVLAIFTASGDPSPVRKNPTPIAAKVMVFDTSTGKEIIALNISDVFDNVDWGSYLASYLAQLSLTEDGKQLLVRAYTRNAKPRQTILLLDAKTGKRIREMAPSQGWFFDHACFSHDAKHILALERNPDASPGRIRVLDLQGAEIRTVALPAGVSFLKFEPLPDGKTLLLTKLEKGVTSLYDFSTGKELQHLRSFSGKKRSLSREGRHLFTPETDKVQMWDVESGVRLQHFDTPGMTEDAYSYSLAVSPDGKRLAVSGPRTFATFDVATGKQLTGGIGASGILGLRFTPNSQNLLVRNRYLDLQQWDVKTAVQVRRFEPSPAFGYSDMSGLWYYSNGITAFSGDGKLVAMMAANKIGVWDAATGKFKNALGGDHASCFAFAPKKSILAIGDGDGTLTLWDPAASKSVRKWKWVEFNGDADDNEDFMICMAFAPNGKTLATCLLVNSQGKGPQGTSPSKVQETNPSQVWIVHWETDTGKERFRVQCNFGRTITRSNYGTDDSEYTGWLFEHLALSISFSPDGQKVVLNTLSGVHVLDAYTGKHLVSHSAWMTSGRTAVFSLDAKLLFFGGVDGSVRVMDVATGRVIREVPAHEARVDALALSPDGKLLASGSADSTVLVWDVAALAKPAALVDGIADSKIIQNLWNDLADIDAAKGFQAMNALAAAPADTVTFFKARLKAVPAVDPKVIEKLVDDLNSDKFAIRDKATKELEKLGDMAGTKLTERLAAQPPLEVHQRINKLLDGIAQAEIPLETLQTLRAIEVLERIRTAQAREVLAALAKGAPGHRITEEARDAVERLDR